MRMHDDGAKIVSVTLTGDGTLEVVKRYESMMVYATRAGAPVPDNVVKEIYGIENGRIVLSHVIKGVHKPAYRVPESIEFPSSQAL